jgi:hypothetical protein
MLHVFLTYSALNQAPIIRALLVSTSCHLTPAFSLLHSLAPKEIRRLTLKSKNSNLKINHTISLLV